MEDITFPDIILALGDVLVDHLVRRGEEVVPSSGQAWCEGL